MQGFRGDGFDCSPENMPSHVWSNETDHDYGNDDITVASDGRASICTYNGVEYLEVRITIFLGNDLITLFVRERRCLPGEDVTIVFVRMERFVVRRRNVRMMMFLMSCVMVLTISATNQVRCQTLHFRKLLKLPNMSLYWQLTFSTI